MRASRPIGLFDSVGCGYHIDKMQIASVIVVRTFLQARFASLFDLEPGASPGVYEIDSPQAWPELVAPTLLTRR